MPGRPPRTVTCEGLVLRRRPAGDADALLVLLTPTHGRVDAIARGVRKPQARLRGHVEPVTRSRFMLAHGRSLEVVAQAETIDAFLGVKADLDALAVALYCCELVERFAVANTPQRELYALALEALTALDQGVPPQRAARYFELHLLATSGYELQLYACAACGTAVAEGENFLAPSAGGLLCPACRTDVPGRLLSVRAQKALRFAARSNIGEFGSLRMPAEVAEELAAALGDAIRSVLDAEPRSARFAGQLLPGGPGPRRESEGSVYNAPYEGESGSRPATN